MKQIKKEETVSSDLRVFFWTTIILSVVYAYGVVIRSGLSLIGIEF